MAEEGTVVPGEEVPNGVEVRAREKGWKGRDESDLPEEDWIDAKEFLGRQKLFDKIHTLNQEIRQTKTQFQKDMGQVSEYIAKQGQVEFDRAMKQLKAEKQIALEDRNLVAVEAINDEIKEKEKEFEEVKQTTPKVQNNSAETTREFNEWRETEQWFDSDKELQREAIAIGTGYAVTNPNLRQTDVLEYVTKMIKRAYPEKFEIKRTQKVENNTVESGGITANSGTSGKKTKGLSKADLDERELSVMRTLIKTNALLTKANKNKISQEQQYLNDLSEVKGLR